MLRKSLAITTLVMACAASVRAQPACPGDGQRPVTPSGPMATTIANRHHYCEFLSLTTSDPAERLARIVTLVELGRFDRARKELQAARTALVPSNPETRRRIAPWHWLIDGKLRRHAVGAQVDAAATIEQRLASLGQALELIERASVHLDRTELKLERVEALLDRYELNLDRRELDAAVRIYESIQDRELWAAIAVTGCRLFEAKGWSSRLHETASALVHAPAVDLVSVAWAHHYLAGPSHKSGDVAAHHLAAVQALDTVRSGITDRRGDTAFVRQFDKIYRGAVTALFDAGETWSALHIAEQFRPRFDGRPAALPSEAECRGGIEDDSILLVLFALPGDTNSRILTWAISANTVRVHSAPIGQDVLTALCGSGPDRVSALRSFYDAVIEPSIGTLDGSKLFLAPHGSLRQIPFDALNDGHQFLVQRFVTSHVRGLLPPGPPDSVQPGPVLALLDPITEYLAVHRSVLPRLNSATREGVREFAEQTTREHRVLTDRAATAEALALYGPSARVVHIASHGEFDSTNPWRSSLYLAGVGTDGRLSAEDLRGLPLSDVDLMVLSGCETGLGEGLAGLPRAAFEAGVEQLIAAVTRVEDRSAARFMTRFYHHLSTDLTPDRALRNAKLDEIRTLETSDQPSQFPLQWASWVLFENPLTGARDR